MITIMIIVTTKIFAATLELLLEPLALLLLPVLLLLLLAVALDAEGAGDAVEPPAERNRTRRISLHGDISPFL